MRTPYLCLLGIGLCCVAGCAEIVPMPAEREPPPFENANLEFTGETATTPVKSPILEVRLLGFYLGSTASPPAMVPPAGRGTGPLLTPVTAISMKTLESP